MVKNVKLFIALISIVVLVLGAYWKRNSYLSSERFLVWKKDKSKLSISHFKKMKDLFAEFDAAVHLTYDVKIDSSLQMIQLELIIDMYKSWFDKSDNPKLDSQLLIHEKYHVLLHEHYIDLINRKLRQDSVSQIDLETSSFVRNMIDEAWKQQRLYDDETQHNTIRDYQRYWEYKIDSLNFSMDDKKGRVECLHTDISAVFPDEPKIGLVIGNGQLQYKTFLLEKYDLRFRVVAYFNYEFDSTTYMENTIMHYKKNNFTEIKHFENRFKNYFGIYTECKDTANNRMYYDQFVRAAPYTYQFTFNHPLDVQSDSIYIKMKTDFFNSAKIERDNSYWINYYENLDTVFLPRIERQFPISIKSQNSAEIINYKEYGNNTIAYKFPFFYDGKLLIPFEVTLHQAEDIEEILLLLNDDNIFSQPFDSTKDSQIIVIDSAKLKVGSNRLNFGYTLKKDSTFGEWYMQNAVIDFID